MIPPSRSPQPGVGSLRARAAVFAPAIANVSCSWTVLTLRPSKSMSARLWLVSLRWRTASSANCRSRSISSSPERRAHSCVATWALATDVLEKPLGAVGMELPKTPQRALASLLFRTAQVRLRGLHFTEREVTQVAPDDLRKIDICWSVAPVLGMVDIIRGSDFQLRALLLALLAPAALAALLPACVTRERYDAVVADAAQGRATAADCAAQRERERAQAARDEERAALAQAELTRKLEGAAAVNAAARTD